MNDRGVQRDIWSRNCHKQGVVAPLIGTTATLAIVDALRSIPGAHGKMIEQLIWELRHGGFPTKPQLDVINRYLEKHGRQRRSCPVRIKGQGGNTKNPVYRMRVAERKNAAKAVDQLAATRPLKPPGAKCES